MPKLSTLNGKHGEPFKHIPSEVWQGIFNDLKAVMAHIRALAARRKAK
jgi:hypothetical protein